MIKANLRTRIDDSIEVQELPSYTLKQLIENTPDNYHLSYDDANSDNIIFELVRDDESIVISGQIRRWQGTHSHIQFNGEVDVPPQVSLIRKTIFGLIVGIPTIYWVWTFILPELLYLLVFGGNILTSDRAVSAFIVTLTSSIILLFFMPILGFVAKSILIRDSNAKKRWQGQQELHKIIKALKILVGEIEVVNNSRLADQKINKRQTTP